MSRSSTASLGFALLVLAGICFVCSLAQFDKKECFINRPRPNPRLRVRQKCVTQGSTCTPSNTLCCGKMGCYNYDGGRCDYPRQDCICRNRQFMADW